MAQTLETEFLANVGLLDVNLNDVKIEAGGSLVIFRFC